MAKSQPTTAFGRTYQQHDTRQMRHILDHLDRTPNNPAQRVNLWVALVALEKELNDEEVQAISNWVVIGGEMPIEKRRPQPPAVPIMTYADPIPSNGEEGSDAASASTEEESEDDEMEDRPGSWGYSATEAGSRGGSVSGGDDDVSVRTESVESPDDHYEHVGIQTSPSLLADLLRQYGVELSIPDLDLESTEYRSPTPVSDVASTAKGDEPVIKPDLDTCAICFEPFSPSYFPREQKLAEECEEKGKTCLDCLSLWLREEVRQGKINKVGCPVCPAILNYETIKKYAAKEDFDHYDYLLFKAAMPDTLVMCAGPRCGSGQIHEGDDVMMICNACGFKTCARHKLPWHEGQTCIEYDDDESQIERMEQEEATAKRIAKSSQICPKCGNGVERSEGCDHMTCRCGNEWCYECLTSYENILRLGETAHARSCPNHPESLGRSRNQDVAHANRITGLIRGEEVDENLVKLRREHAENRRAGMRPLVALAAERRIEAMRKARGEAGEGQGDGDGGGEGEGEGKLQTPDRKRRRVLKAPWEER